MTTPPTSDLFPSSRYKQMWMDEVEKRVAAEIKLIRVAEANERMEKALVECVVLLRKVDKQSAISFHDLRDLIVNIDVLLSSEKAVKSNL